MSESMQLALDKVIRVRGVRGALIVTREDGLVVTDALREDVRGNAVAALAASLARRVGDAALASGVGAPQFLHLQATEGALLAATAGDELLIVAVAEAGVNVGLVRLEMIRAAASVQ
jgi:predicted regulator of Ras-like GTPase activity (Roadblock/LC7/MglB family)